MALWYVEHAGDLGGYSLIRGSGSPWGTPPRQRAWHGTGDTPVSKICCAGWELLRLDPPQVSPRVPVCRGTSHWSNSPPRLAGFGAAGQRLRLGRFQGNGR